jgi:3-dehydroquinate synthase
LKRITVELPGKSYPVLIGDSVLQRIGREVTHHSGARAVIIDRNVEKLHGAKIRNIFSKLKGDTEYLILKNGETSKSLNELNRIYKFLIRENFTKQNMIFAIGGGVTGDVAGFAASTFKRGIPIIHIPTTLLSAVDSSVGGKTAINLKNKKNIIGSFHQPDYVFTDVSFLETLPKQEVNSGIGELIKYTFLSEPNFFFYVLNNLKKIRQFDNRVLENVIYKSVQIKSSIVMKDEKEESGLRKILNFGHTFGHAIESVMNYRIKHGEAVVAGITAALHLSNILGILPENRLVTYLKLPQKIKLPPGIRKIDFQEVFDAMKYDKKNKGTKINFVLLSEIGSMLIDISAGKEQVYKSLEKMIDSV